MGMRFWPWVEEALRVKSVKGRTGSVEFCDFGPVVGLSML